MDPQLRGTDLPFIPPQASSAAGEVDALLLGVTLVGVFFSLGIFLTLVYFVARYRKGRKVDRHRRVINHLPIEATWTLVPLGIATGIFFWGASLFLKNETVSADATPIYVVGKQWMWKVQHPEGRWEINSLHVPVGHPAVLVLTSEDVVHSFFVPAFRLKQDAIPGQYTRLPFTPTRVGAYHLFCAEFCGTFHSNMTGVVTVMEPGEYERWLREGDRSPTVAQAGEELFRRFGCSGCHLGGSVRAPRLEGVFGSMVPVQVPTEGLPLERTPAHTVLADERYIHDSIVLPEKEIAAGYPAIMPSYRNRITEAQIFQIMAYLRTLASPAGPTAEPDSRREAVSGEEIRARTGFTPRGGAAPGTSGPSGRAGAGAAGRSDQ